MSDVASDTKHRLGTLDAARFLAAVAVVAIHVCQSPTTVQWTTQARFAVPFFSAAAAYLLATSQLRKSQNQFGSFALERWQRLYLPFVVWSVIYVLLKSAKQRLMPDQPSQLPGWDFWFAGGDYHLWFIPFLLIASILLYPLTRTAAAKPTSQQQLATASFALGIFVATLLAYLPLPDHSLTYMAWTVPGFTWGAALAWLNASQQAIHSRPLQRWQNVTLTAALFVLCQTLLFTHGRSALLENSAGISLLVLALSLPNLIQSTVIVRLGQVSLGIYFSHLAFVKVLGPVLEKSVTISAPLQAAFLLVLATGLAAGLSLLLRRWERTRWLVA